MTKTLNLELKSRVMTPTGRVTWAKFFPPKKSEEPNPDTGEYDKWWECSLVIPKDDPGLKVLFDLEKLHVQEAFNGKKPHGFKSAIRQDESFDLDDPRYSWYKGNVIVSMRSKNQEVIPVRVIGKREDGKAILEECTKDNFFSGVYAKAKVTMYHYNVAGSKGVACGLQNIYLVRTGEPLSTGKRRAEDDLEGADLDEFEVDNSALISEDEDY